MSATNILRSTTHGNTWKLLGNIMEKYGNFWETVSIGAQKLFTAEDTAQPSAATKGKTSASPR